MIDQVFDGFRKTAESTMQMQQDFLKQVTQQWYVMPGMQSDWSRAIQKRWLELTVELLNKHRESLDEGYKLLISSLEASFQSTEGKSPQEQQQAAEDLWRRFFDTFRSQYESQMQELQKFSTLPFEMVGRAQAQQT